MPPTPEQTREAHFRGLYAEHYDAVSRFVRRRGSPSDVDDIVAETFLVAWRRLEDVPTGPGEALPWLYEDQEVLGLALFEDLTSTAAARVIGTSPSAYRLRLSRARRRLRALLSPATATPLHAVAPAAIKELT